MLCVTSCHRSAVTGSSITRTFTISSLGLSDLDVSSITFSGAQSGEFSVVPSSATGIAPSSSVEVAVTATPGNGLRSAVMEIANNDPDEGIEDGR